MSRRPPSALRWLLGACLPPGTARSLLGDLEELYGERRARDGGLSADLWYARQLAGVARHYLPGRLAWGRDLRLAARRLRDTPGFTAVAVLTLGVGVGAVTGMFTVLDQVVLRALPVTEQDEVVVAWNHHRVREMSHFPVLGDVYRILEDEAASFRSVAGTGWGNPTEVLVESPDGTATVLRQTRVLGDFFGVLGVTAVLGRLLGPDDDIAGAEPVAVLSHALWQDRYGGDPAVVGTTLMAGRVRVRIVGVAPEGFGYPVGTDLWIPLRALHPGWAGDGPPPVEIDLVGRLAPGVTATTAAEEMKRIYREHPALAGSYQQVDPVVRPLSHVVLGDLRTTLILLFAGATLVLMVACVNVANLVLVRAGNRRTTLAIRRALGAGRGRIAAEGLAEGLLLGGAGGLAGMALAWLSVRIVLSRVPPGMPRLDDVSAADPATFASALGVTGVVALVVGLLPLLRSGDVEPAAALRGVGAGGSGRRRRGSTLMILGQTGLAVWATATAVLLFRTLVNLQALDPGIRTDDVTLVELDQPYPLFQVPPELPDRMRRVGDRLEALPWVEDVTSSFARPMDAAGGVVILGRRDDQPADEAAAENPYVNVEVVGPGYFRLLDLHVGRGRAFTPDDRRAGRPVAVVNRKVADALWPGRDPVGQRMVGFRDERWTVVGVAEDTRYQSLTDLLPTVYLPLGQLDIFPPRYLLVRTSEDGPILAPVREALAEIDPAIRVKGASSLRARLEAPLARPRFSALVLGILGGAVLLLATVGVYGVMTARVRARSAELGLRIALGARPGGVRALVLKQGMARAALGAALGVAAVVPSSRLVEHLLYGVPSTDPGSLASAAVLVLAAAALACWIPAHRAATLDPVRTLRSE